MRRFFASIMVVLICFNNSRCTKYVDPPIPETQRLLMTGSWILTYTDSISIDSTNTVHYYHLPARDCERSEPITFADSFKYYIHLVCDQPVPGSLTGVWTYGADSMLAYGLQTDTGLSTFLNTAKLLFINSDSLKLGQPSSFASPDDRYQFYVEKTYSR